MKPGGAGFGPLWGPLGVRRTTFGCPNGFAGVLFSHVFVELIFDSCFHRFLMNFGEVKEHDFTAFFDLLPFELFLRTVSFTWGKHTIFMFPMYMFP